MGPLEKFVMKLKYLEILNHITTTKEKFQELRENGWESLFATVVSFYKDQGIDVPDMNAPHKKGTDRPSQHRDVITIEHYYHFDIVNVVIDKQLAELDDRFPEQSKELLILSASLDPRDGFKSFKEDDICSLAKKFYPQDFTSSELHALNLQLAFYGEVIRQHPDLSDLCVKLVKTRLAEDYHLILRLVRLVLTLLVFTSTTERAFSALRIIKNRLRSKIKEEFFDDCMIVHN
ncbi:uncharacterized protein LOC126803694 [Argentina anserina]|uniref:uncharacterized protein LOC126803694 n=1 Tax=Argentina anserina TaxID=57926 RepID=UPI00217693DD|nr:uncharacterized protein LOC126803694 [Potentilla anserina]